MPKGKWVFSPEKVARLERLELPTRCLEGSCSIQAELQAHRFQDEK